jgi:hypothetical protein
LCVERRNKGIGHKKKYFKNMFAAVGISTIVHSFLGRLSKVQTGYIEKCEKSLKIVIITIDPLVIGCLKTIHSLILFVLLRLPEKSKVKAGEKSPIQLKLSTYFLHETF